MSTADEFFIPEHITLSVKRGAYFLDGKIPGWEKRLNLATLDLRNGCQCVIGQLEGTYCHGLNTLGLKPAHHDFVAERTTGEPVDLGFYDTCDSADGWPQLTEAWKREVSTRLGDVA